MITHAAAIDMDAKKTFLLTVMLLWNGSYANAAETVQPVVLELFTSQGCSSCPPADALLTQLSAADSGLLPLSFHVNYWDHLGWKDTYSSSVNTERQKTYAHVLGLSSMFTPQLIVNGTASMVGSSTGEVHQAIATAHQTANAITVSLAPDKGGHKLMASMAANNPAAATVQADIWEIHFDRYAKTPVAAGENGGRTLESINNVTSITSLGTWHPDAAKTLALDLPPGDSVAIIVQTQGQGPVLGAASYIK